MEFVAVRSVKNEKPSKLDDSIPLSLYLEAPAEELTIDEFELLSLDRLQLLRSIEQLKLRGFDESQVIAKIRELEKKHFVAKKEFFPRLLPAQRDLISHFILRLGFCRTEDLRRWFLTQECILFKARLDSMNEQEKHDFMYSNGVTFEPVSNEEKNEKAHLFLAAAGKTSTNDFQVHKMTFFKVPFTQALQLVGRRAVYLEKGYAYVPLQSLVSIIVSRFRLHLSRALTEASLLFDVVTGDTRIGPLLKNLNKQYIGNDFSQKGTATDKLTIDQIDNAAEVHMPLCMKNLHINLKREHKLKHWGRLQYTLFLKGAGLDHENAQAFWESHFTKVMAHDQFVKNYAYSFRHMYGKEGGRKSYTPYSCMKIIMGTPPEPGAHHGCPYRHMPDGQLASLLMSMKLNSTDVKSILDTSKKESNYQLACQKHFDITHPGHYDMDLKLSDHIVANHPNQWYQASVNYHKLKNGQAVGSNVVSGSNSANSTQYTPTTQQEVSVSSEMEVVENTGSSAMDV